MEREGPWFAESAIKLLDHHIGSNDPMYILETGMGSSTVYLQSRCKSLVSIEHDKEWFDKTSSSLQCSVINDKLILAERPYNNIIDQQPDNYFDIIIVDGRDRVKCIQSSIPKLKSGGWLIVDNSEREYYKPGIDLMKDWNRIDCRQNRPDKYDFTYPDWTTSIFIKP